MTCAYDASAALDDLLAQDAWALVRLHGEDRVYLLGGTTTDHDLLRDVPLEPGTPDGRRFDRLLAVPYRQIRERGFAAYDDGTPLRALDIATETAVPLDELMPALPDEPIRTVGEHGFETSDEAYESVVERIIRDEIGRGEGANLVVGREYHAQIADWGHAKALTAFRNLLQHERGAYWTFCVFTGDRHLVGASPERHVSVNAGEVRMNPISGTFRVGDITDAAERKRALLEFLRDEKEIYELFMVVDEELKMMCDICSEGGQILGPFLKPMTHLVHTEYVLAGRSTQDPRDILRDSMFAATVTGSPVENACRLIEKYEQRGRRYYASVLALLGRDASGRPTVDAPILLRTADIDRQGNLVVTAGATLVRDSDPAYEVAETHAKAGGVLTAFGLRERPSAAPEGVAALAQDEDVLVALGRRNNRLSQFWFDDQSGVQPDQALHGKHVVILDGEDDFITMLRHMLGVLGMTSETVRHHEYEQGAFSGADLVVIGPGPGDPRDLDDPKIAKIRQAVDDVLNDRQPFVAVCLGHQVLAGALGLPLAYKDIVFQGTQAQLPVLGRSEVVGFYNTFVARVDDTMAMPSGVTVETDPATGDVHLLAGPHFRSIQFHAESILTERGIDVVHELVSTVLRGAQQIR